MDQQNVAKNMKIAGNLKPICFNDVAPKERPYRQLMRLMDNDENRFDDAYDNDGDYDDVDDDGDDDHDHDSDISDDDRSKREQKRVMIRIKKHSVAVVIIYIDPIQFGLPHFLQKPFFCQKRQILLLIKGSLNFKACIYLCI